MLRFGRIGIPVLVAGLLLALAIGSASAQQQTVVFSGAVTPGETVTLTCPEGYVVQVNADGPDASMSFFRTSKRKGVIDEFVPPTSTTTTTASWLVPRGARYAEGSLNCIPAVEETTTTLAATVAINQDFVLAPGGQIDVSCPSGYVLDLNSPIVVTYPGTYAVLEGNTTIRIYNGSLAILQGNVTATCNLVAP